MARKQQSILDELKDIQLASELIKYGARLQLLELEVGLSRDRLIKLYREVRDESPTKGMLPFSIDWFLTWQPNIHSTLFYVIYQKLRTHTELTGIEANIKAYKLYLEHMPIDPGEEPVLSLTRSWILLRFINRHMLGVTDCQQCGGEFIVLPYAKLKFVCGLCHPPSRAGKKVPTKKMKTIELILD